MSYVSLGSSSYHGYRRIDFEVAGAPAIVVEPAHPLPGKRWVWRAEFFDAFAAFDLEMLRRGWWLAYLRVGNTFGCPAAMRKFDAFYDEMVGTRGFHARPVLEGLSRGGLYVYNWAARHPEKVGLIYADNPVCDFKSWPGGKGKGPGSPRDWQALLDCHGFKDEEEAMNWPHNPVDGLAPVIAEEIPLVHVYGDADEVVPWEENTGLLARRVQELGGRITLHVKPGGLHHPHGPENPVGLADWVIGNTR